MCDESKTTDKETREETSEPRKSYFLNGVKMGYVAGVTGIVILSNHIYGDGDIFLFYGQQLDPIPVYLIFILFFSSFIAIKHRQYKFKNICKEMIGIVLMMIIIHISQLLYLLSLNDWLVITLP